jgi:hypothetical protein
MRVGETASGWIVSRVASAKPRMRSTRVYRS